MPESLYQKWYKTKEQSSLLDTTAAVASSTAIPGTTVPQIEQKERARSLYQAYTGQKELPKPKPDIIQQALEAKEPGAAIVHGVAGGATFGGAQKLLDQVHKVVDLGEKPTEKRERLKQEYPELTGAAEFGGSLVPLTKGFKAAHWVGGKLLPNLSTAGKVVRAGVTGQVVGTGLLKAEGKPLDEAIRGGSIWAGIGAGAAGLAPATIFVAGKKVPVISRVAGWLVDTKNKQELITKLERFYGESGYSRHEAKRIAKKLAGFSPAEQQRLTQIIKGGVTKQPELGKAAQPAIDIFEKLGLRAKGKEGFWKETYTHKMTKAERGQLALKEKQLQDDILRDLFGKSPERAAKEVGVAETIRGDLNNFLKKRMILQRQLGLQGGVEQELNFLAGESKAEKLVKDLIDTEDKIFSLARTHGIKGRRYPGRTKGVQAKLDLLDDITEQRYWSDHYGGTKYFPTLYKTKEELPRAGLPFSSGKRIRAHTSYAKSKSLYLAEHPEIKKQMGEIIEASYPVEKRASQLGRDLALQDLFDSVVKDPLLGTLDEAAGVASGWRRFSTTNKGLGPLRGAWARDDVYDTVNEMLRMPGDVEQFYNQYLTFWKWSKVVPRVATWSRNIMNNFIFTDFAGLSPTKHRKQLQQALGDNVGKKDSWIKLLKAGKIGTEYLPVEVRALTEISTKHPKNLFGWGLEYAKRSMGGLSRFYSAQDQVFKQWIYLVKRSEGLSEKAAIEAVRWMPDYRRVPKATQFLRQAPVGAPFFSFTSEAVRILGMAAREEPLKFMKWMTLPHVVTEVAKRTEGLSDEEYDNIVKGLPKYMQLAAKSGLLMLVPDLTADKKSVRFLDGTFLFPQGNIVEFGEGLQSVVSNPVSNFTSAVLTGEDALGRDIVDHPLPSVKDEIAGWGKWALKSPAPSPSAAIYDIPAWKETIEGKKQFWSEKPRPYGETIASTGLGLKTREFKKAKLEEYKSRQMRGKIWEVRGKMRRIEMELEENREYYKRFPNRKKAKRAKQRELEDRLEEYLEQLE